MEKVTVMFTLPNDTFEALKATAKREGAAPGAILRSALKNDLKERTARKDRKPNDPAFVSAIRTLLARDIAKARGWADLLARLRARGYELRIHGDRLSLFGADTGECLVDATEIGASYGALLRRFGGPLPGSKASA